MALRCLRGVKYSVIGEEAGPQNGIPHLHCCVIFNNGKRWRTLKNQFNRADIELPEHGVEACINYCKKEGKFWELGTPPVKKGQAEKQRWSTARLAAAEGRFGDIPDDIYIRYRGNLLKIFEENRPPPEPIEIMDFHWFYGETGTGKSRTARTENPKHYIKLVNKWWDGYDDKKYDCVIIEEWGLMPPDVERAMGTLLKTWADHHPFQAETKGGMRMFRPKKIIVTSNYSMEEIFKDPQNLDPLKRRFTVTHFWQDFPRPACPPLTPTQEQAQTMRSPSLSEIW